VTGLAHPAGDLGGASSRTGGVNRREFVVAAAAVPFWRLAPAARAGGNPVALVTADLESHIAVVELGSARIVKTIPTLPGPRSVQDASGRIAVVTHTKIGAVTLINGPALSVRRVLHDFREPRYTATHPRGRYAFVTDSKTGDVVTVDLAHSRTLGRVALDGPSRHITIDPTGRTLWVALGFSAERIAIVDVTRPERPRLRRYFAPPFHAHDVGFTADGRHVWVSSGDRGTLAVYDALDARPLRRLAADAPPQHVTFLGSYAYVASGEDARVRMHSLRDGRIVRTTVVPEGSYNVQEAFGSVVTPSLDRGTLCVLGRDGKLLRRVAVARSSHDACFVMAA
jgi:DNA-binding beta-propeller fold protein YncE